MATTPKTVLVVDDDERIVEALTLFIDGEKFRTIGVTDPHEALRLARQISPAVVLCDWSMPDIDGGEVIRRLRADPLPASLKIVLVSGFMPPHLDRLGANAFLSKPFTPEEVLGMVSTMAA